MTNKKCQYANRNFRNFSNTTNTAHTTTAATNTATAATSHTTTAANPTAATTTTTDNPIIFSTYQTVTKTVMKPVQVQEVVERSPINVLADVVKLISNRKIIEMDCKISIQIEKNKEQVDSVESADREIIEREIVKFTQKDAMLLKHVTEIWFCTYELDSRKTILKVNLKNECKNKLQCVCLQKLNLTTKSTTYKFNFVYDETDNITYFYNIKMKVSNAITRY